MNFTDGEIEEAKRRTTYTDEAYHEHTDCVRIAVAWLDAQRRVMRPGRQARPLKHIIEAWAGRYVSAADVSVAAVLVGLKGSYPRFNVSSRLVRPNMARLEGIGEAGTQPSYRARYQDVYSRDEDVEVFAAVECEEF